MQKKNVNLIISNKQYAESLEPKGEAFSRELNLEDSLEIVTEGRLYAKKGATYITYEESEDSGLENKKTVIKFGEGTLRIKRYGSDADGNMDLVLEEGLMNITRYHVPFAVLDLEIYTHTLSDDLSDEGYGKIKADYSIKFDKFVNRRNKLEIEVKPN